VIAILCTDGALEVNDIRHECHYNKWAPVLTYQKDSVTTVVVFNNEEVAKKFVKRNINKKWVIGVVYLGDEGVEFIKSKGWSIEIMDWPRKLDEFRFEVIEFETSPDVQCTFG